MMGKYWIIIAFCVSSFCSSDGQGPTAKFSNMTVQGIVKKTRLGRDVDSYMGIPYAEPPIGPLRFRNPVPKVYPDGSTLMADKPPIPCLHSTASVIGDANSTRDIKGEEDCLYLNVYRPTSAGNQSLPVMVYFQAGDLFEGTEDVAYVGPDYLLDRDIILVTVTYRLGVFGFFSTADELAPGNYGLKDQKVALQWVQSNIAGFGGNPNRVTLFGHGEAAKLIHLHALVDHTAGLFHQYILQSGTALAPWATIESQRFSLWVSELIILNRCYSNSRPLLIECLRMIDSRQLLESSYELFTPLDISFNKMWGPIKEPKRSPDAFLKDCPEVLIARGVQRDLPFIAGVTFSETVHRESADYVDEDWLTQNYKGVMNIYRMVFGYTELHDRVNDFYARRDFDSDYSALPTVESYKEPLLNSVFGMFERFVYFLDDLSFYAPLVKMLEERRKNSKKQFYFYSFEYGGTFGTLDWMMNAHMSGDAVHGDDLLYLFHHDKSKFPGSYGHGMNGKDYRMITTMVELWTSFATEGVPRSQYFVDWEPYGSQGRYLKIGSKRSANVYMKSNYHLRRMNFWANVTLHTCGSARFR